MAYAGAKFVNSLLEAAILGRVGVRECCYVQTDLVNGLDYFSSLVEFSNEGVNHVHEIPKLSAFEQGLLDAAIPELKANIQKGVDFVLNLK